MINLKPTKFDAIVELVGGDGGISGADDGTLMNYREKTPPSDSAIETKLAEMLAEYDAQAYSRNRALEYPSNGDQWDMIYKDNKNSTTTHADAVEAVKTKWPKDNSGPV